LDRNPYIPPDGLVGDNSGAVGVAGVAVASRWDPVSHFLYPGPEAVLIPASSGWAVQARVVDLLSRAGRPCAYTSSSSVSDGMSVDSGVSRGDKKARWPSSDSGRFRKEMLSRCPDALLLAVSILAGFVEIAANHHHSIRRCDVIQRCLLPPHLWPVG
jgi:hypothetical protein